MKTESHELKHITAFTIYVIDPETSKTWGAWNRYTEGQYGVGAYTNTDDEIGRDHHSYRKLDYNNQGNSCSDFNQNMAGMMMYSPMLHPSQNINNKAAFFEIQIDTASENTIEVSKEVEEQTQSSNINDFEFFSTFDSGDRQKSQGLKQAASDEKLLPVSLGLGVADQSELTASNSKSQNRSGGRECEGIKMTL